MTKQQFKDLKVTDRVFIPHVGNDGYMIDTEVLDIKRRPKQIKVLLGGERFYSYRYIRKILPPDKYKVSCSVGVVLSDYPILRT